MTTHLLVLDAGTGSGRAVVFDRAGNQVGVAQEEWRHLPEPGVPGSMAFDIAGGWALLRRCIQGALASLRADRPRHRRDQRHLDARGDRAL
ncbi:hypothetical protein ACTTAM_03460 [Rhodobacter capsulatus]|uniref:hypothetical protein n=1 Tax=Rhodobacter capsulatus TaxID=1061 RepID=UPI00402610BA